MYTLKTNEEKQTLQNVKTEHRGVQAWGFFEVT